MKNASLPLTIFAALTTALAVFAYLRIIDDHALVARLGLLLTAGFAAATGLLIGRKLRTRD